ncbi:globin domain-containing protein [Marinicella sp. W31]|uniref:globin domain-containing protein n=1 Tax=Marinicella sp. W31 TaxID=3023713 RepID=UPI00375702F6
MQLSEQTKKMIKRTAPLLKSQGEHITCHMYVLLFSRYPQTTELFSETGKQPQKLAQAIVAFATHVDALDQLQPVLYEISKRHVAAGVRPAHYLMVAEVLMDAMTEILGSDVFTRELRQAWQQAYQVLATHLIQQEQQMLLETALEEV